LDKGEKQTSEDTPGGGEMRRIAETRREGDGLGRRGPALRQPTSQKRVGKRTPR